MKKPKRKAARELIALEKHLNKTGRTLRPGLRRLLDQVLKSEEGNRSNAKR